MKCENMKGQLASMMGLLGNNCSQETLKSILEYFVVQQSIVDLLENNQLESQKVIKIQTVGQKDNYSLVTWNQGQAHRDQWPCLEIQDYPEFLLMTSRMEKFHQLHLILLVKNQVLQESCQFPNLKEIIDQKFFFLKLHNFKFYT